jgi:hypothetical protein
MNELLLYFSSRLMALAAAVAFGAVAVETLLRPYVLQQLGAAHWGVTVIGYANSRPAIVGLLAAGVYLVRKVTWKIEKPELNLSGRWRGETAFTVVRSGSGAPGHVTTYDVSIEQDCLAIRIVPSRGDEFVNWGSLAIELSDKDTLRYAYWVTYSDSSRFPEGSVVGYEEVRVTGRDDRGRPIELTGTFDHCARGQTPLYSGHVRFTRLSPAATGSFWSRWRLG